MKNFAYIYFPVFLFEALNDNFQIDFNETSIITSSLSDPDSHYKVNEAIKLFFKQPTISFVNCMLVDI